MNPPNTSPALLVTGASRGIGRAIAIHAARTGWSVGINYRTNVDAAGETLKACTEAAQHERQVFQTIRGDVSVATDRKNLMQFMIDAFGRIDALVNNAGMAPRERRDIVDATEESFREVVNANLIGPYFLTQSVARHWLSGTARSRSASFIVVNVSSISAEVVSLNRGEYCISKAGLSMATKLWATRLAPHGISVIEIRPGIIESDMTAGAKDKYDELIADGLIPERRWGTADDVGKVVAAVLKNDITYSTGSIIHVDGGLHIQKL